MKIIGTLLALTLCLTSQAQNMSNYLVETDKMIRQGKYDEALERCIWFHNHSLEYSPSMYGVRLSFALSDWKALADVYPPALIALKEIRDKKTDVILTNAGTKELFHDVLAINMALGERTKTIDLFLAINKENPETAKIYWPNIKKEVFIAKRYDIVNSFIEDPLDEFNNVLQKYKKEIARIENQKSGKRIDKRITANNFVLESIQLIEYSMAIGDLISAKEIQTKALNMVKNKQLKKLYKIENKSSC